jgi:hypothetical protein
MQRGFANKDTTNERVVGADGSCGAGTGENDDGLPERLRHLRPQETQ